MFWVGRLNAVLAIVTFVGLICFWVASGPGDAAAWLFTMFLLRVALKILDVIWTAATGNPLFYQIKILDREDGR